MFIASVLIASEFHAESVTRDGWYSLKLQYSPNVSELSCFDKQLASEAALETHDSVIELRIEQFDSDSGSLRLGPRSNIATHTSNLSVQDGVLGPFLFLFQSPFRSSIRSQCSLQVSLLYVLLCFSVEKQCLMLCAICNLLRRMILPECEMVVFYKHI